MDILRIPIHGQGVFLFKCLDTTQPCSFVWINETSDYGIRVKLTTKHVKVFNIHNGEEYENTLPTNEDQDRGLLSKIRILLVQPRFRKSNTLCRNWRTKNRNNESLSLCIPANK